jgi:hypothetical protein
LEVIGGIDDSEEVDSDIECEFYGPGDIESGGSQGPPESDIDEDGVPDSEDNCVEVANPDQQIQMETVWVMFAIHSQQLLIFHKKTNSNLTRFFLASV